MGKMHFGPKHLISSVKRPEESRAAIIAIEDLHTLKQTNSDLEQKINELSISVAEHRNALIESESKAPTVLEKIVDRIVYEEKQVEKEVIRYVEVEKIVDRIVSVEKEIPVYVDKIVHNTAEIIKEIKFIPQYIYGVIAVEALIILGLITVLVK